MGTLSALPDELLRAILSEMPVDDLLRAGSVCHRWMRIVQDEATWRQKFSAHLRHSATKGCVGKWMLGARSWREEVLNRYRLVRAWRRTCWRVFNETPSRDRWKILLHADLPERPGEAGSGLMKLSSDNVVSVYDPWEGAKPKPEKMLPEKSAGQAPRAIGTFQIPDGSIRTIAAPNMDCLLYGASTGDVHVKWLSDNIGIQGPRPIRENDFWQPDPSTTVSSDAVSCLSASQIRPDFIVAAYVQGQLLTLGYAEYPRARVIPVWSYLMDWRSENPSSDFIKVSTDASGDTAILYAPQGEHLLVFEGLGHAKTAHVRKSIISPPPTDNLIPDGSETIVDVEMYKSLGSSFIVLRRSAGTRLQVAHLSNANKHDTDMLQARSGLETRRTLLDFTLPAKEYSLFADADDVRHEFSAMSSTFGVLEGIAPGNRKTELSHQFEASRLFPASVDVPDLHGKVFNGGALNDMRALIAGDTKGWLHIWAYDPPLGTLSALPLLSVRLATKEIVAIAMSACTIAALTVTGTIHVVDSFSLEHLKAFDLPSAPQEFIRGASLHIKDHHIYCALGNGYGVAFQAPAPGVWGGGPSAGLHRGPILRHEGIRTMRQRTEIASEINDGLYDIEDERQLRQFQAELNMRYGAGLTDDEQVQLGIMQSMEGLQRDHGPQHMSNDEEDLMEALALSASVASGHWEGDVWIPNA